MDRHPKLLAWMLFLVDTPCTRSFAIPSTQGPKVTRRSVRLEKAPCANLVELIRHEPEG